MIDTNILYLNPTYFLSNEKDLEEELVKSGLFPKCIFQEAINNIGRVDIVNHYNRCVYELKFSILNRSSARNAYIQVMDYAEYLNYKP
ncbi:MAG: hypothetical protein R3321_01430 [Nitrososphaeraceae archaeon]|nr:hypothetical protein [Nitrososphaeraceae archaeon]